MQERFSYKIENSDAIFSSQALIDYLYQEIITIRQFVLDQQSSIRSFFLASSNFPYPTYPFFSNNPPCDIWKRKMNCDIHTSQFQLPKNLIAYNDLRIFITYLIAAIVISRIEQFDQYHFLKCIFQLYKINKVVCKENCDIPEKVFQQLMYAKQDLIQLLLLFCNHYTIEVYDNMLNETKNWVSLEKPSVIIMTHVKLKFLNNIHLLIIDEPQCKLTYEQQLSFQTTQHQEWYKHLSFFQQQLVNYYKTRILTEKYVIPSQLRSILPLQKNAYLQSIWVKKNNQWQQLNTYYHCGTVSYLYANESIALAATKHNLLQQQAQGATGASLMIALNSLLVDKVLSIGSWLCRQTYQGDDSTIIKLSKQAAEALIEKNIYFSKICLNGFRTAEFHDYNGIDNIINIVNQNLIHYRQDHLLMMLNKLLEAFSSLKKQWTIFDLENKGLDLIYLLTKIAFLNNQIIQDQSLFHLLSIGICFGCASGENRTGIVCYHIICLSLINYVEYELGVSLSEIEKKQLYIYIAATQHVQIMTGFQGGSLGTEGIRKQSASSLTSNHPAELLLISSAERKSIPRADFLNYTNNQSINPYRLFSENKKYFPFNYLDASVARKDLHL